MNKIKMAILREFANIVLTFKSESYRKNKSTKRMIIDRIISEVQSRKWSHERNLPYDETLLKQDAYLLEQVKAMLEFEIEEKLKEWGY